jgi:O-acetyl-ADP-ribose deacetylase
MAMRISIFSGEITDAPAEAVCTSTNPRLSLMMGTGGAVRDRGGFEILRACEEIIEQQAGRDGVRELPLGSAHLTTAGALPFKAVIHCVASDVRHMSSAAVIASCVRNGLLRAEEAGIITVAMPVFATGHAGYRFERALRAMSDALDAAETSVEHVVIVVPDEQRRREAAAVFEAAHRL